MNLRARAAKALYRVVDTGLTLDAAMEPSLHGIKGPRDRSFVKELCFGTLRWFDQLEWLLDHCLERPLKPGDADIRMLILVGLYQLRNLGAPPHAAVSETVGATVELDKPWAKPLVNALLRRALREAQQLNKELDRHPGARYSHPDWLIDRIRTDWPEQWEAILKANNRRPPQHLRVNLLRATRERYLKELESAGIEALALALTPCGIQLPDPVDVSWLPDFDCGSVSVQDAGAQLAAGLLDLQPGNLVLDACAAPGGKTAHILESQPQIGAITAVDADERRNMRLLGTLNRLNLDATVIQADATDTEEWWNGEQFDRILLDAPCSATGVIRRHPDIKRRKAPEQLPALQTTQLELLTALWPLLKPGGKLLYSTCSLLRGENDGVIESFLDDHPSAKPDTISAKWGVATEHGRQLLPGLDDTDGFYYAVLTHRYNSGVRPRN